MSTSNSTIEVDDDDDIELLEVRHKRRIRETLSEPHQSNGTLMDFQDHSAPSQYQSSREPVDPPQNDTKEDTNAKSKQPLEDEVMIDTTIDLTRKDYVKLPSLGQLLPKADRTPEPERNIDRPHYNAWAHCEGFVAWWDNRTGKGMIVNYRYSLEHKVELDDIKWSNYGALVPGSMVEYEYSDDGISKGFSKLWVLSGCEFVLWKDAWENEEKYLYMEKVKREYWERDFRYGREI